MDNLENLEELEESIESEEDFAEEEFQKIAFYDEELGGDVEFFIIARTKVNGKDYLLAAQELEEDTESDAFIFRVSEGDFDHLEDVEDASDIVLELVEDATELEAIGKVFAELLEEDMNIEV